MKTVAPGKVILTGEHSVVYGKPAVAIALKAHVTACLSDRNSASDEWAVKLVGRKGLPFSPSSIIDLVANLDRRFERFMQGQLPIKSVLSSPEYLLIYAMCQGARDTLSSDIQGVVDSFRDVSPQHLTTQSTIRAGGGMGSSAAAIAAAIRLGEALRGHELSALERMKRVRFCERLQHGRGSAIDAAAVSFGGKVRLCQDVPEQISLPLLSNAWFLVNTGRSKVSTGECVTYVREHFAESDIWQAFEAVSNDLMLALAREEAPLAAIKENHRLLDTLGVVPETVADFIAHVESQGGAAKVSGSGAHLGDQAGLVLVYHQQGDVIKRLCKAFGYRVWPLQEEKNGVQLFR